MRTESDRGSSLRRRLSFAGNSYLFCDGVAARPPFSRFAVLGDWMMPRIPDQLFRVGYDLLESVRTGQRVPDIGGVEMSLADVTEPLPQHPRLRGYWHDPARHAAVGLFVGADLIRHGGKYYVIELNMGPSLYPRRRMLYDTPFDPLVTALVSFARAQGFEALVPIAFRWDPLYLQEFIEAGRQHGIRCTPTVCPLRHPEAPSLVALPDPLAARTLYVIHSGLFTPAFRFVADKWYSAQWLRRALEEDLPADTLVALPTTYEEPLLPGEDPGLRWPNLVIKLAAGARAQQVLAGRFRDEQHVRDTLGLRAGRRIPVQLQGSYLKHVLMFGGDRVLYQAFVPPEVDALGRARLYRLHLFTSPLGTTFLSAHARLSRGLVPDHVPSGIIRGDDAFLFNNADYETLPPDTLEELQSVTADLGRAIHGAVSRTFETSSEAVT